MDRRRHLGNFPKVLCMLATTPFALVTDLLSLVSFTTLSNHFKHILGIHTTVLKHFFGIFSLLGAAYFSPFIPKASYLYFNLPKKIHQTDNLHAVAVRH